MRWSWKIAEFRGIGVQHAAAAFRQSTNRFHIRWIVNVGQIFEGKGLPGWPGAAKLHRQKVKTASSGNNSVSILWMVARLVLQKQWIVIKQGHDPLRSWRNRGAC